MRRTDLSIYIVSSCIILSASDWFLSVYEYHIIELQRGAGWMSEKVRFGLKFLKANGALMGDGSGAFLFGMASSGCVTLGCPLTMQDSNRNSPFVLVSKCM